MSSLFFNHTVGAHIYHLRIISKDKLLRRRNCFQSDLAKTADSDSRMIG